VNARNDDSPSTPLTRADGLRVALFSGNYNYVKEGANQALNRLVGHLLAQGAAVRVYSPTTANPAFAPVGDLVSVPSVPIPFRPEFRFALGMPKGIRDDVRAFAPNLVHLSTPDWLGGAAQRFARGLGVPVFASLHTRFETYFEHYGLSVLRSWALARQGRFYRACDFVFAPNEPSRQHLAAMGVRRDRIGIWGRGIDTALFSPGRRDPQWRRAHGYADGEAVILFFGRLVREKGIAVFAETVAELRRRGRRARPLVVGDGPARREMADVLGDAVFTGHLQGEPLARAVASADIFLNPSLTETFGNVTLEAMASGLVAVCADLDVTRALISDGYNGLLSRHDARSYADALKTLLGQPERAAELGSRAADSAGRHRWPEILDAVVRAYREIGDARVTASGAPPR
jgi:glycosyltransferase involved in cell wall biosynthesis